MPDEFSSDWDDPPEPGSDAKVGDENLAANQVLNGDSRELYRDTILR